MSTLVSDCQIQMGPALPALQCRGALLKMVRCGGCNVVLSTSPHSACDLLHSSTELVMPLVTRPPLLPLCARCSWCRGAPPCWSASPLHQTSPIQSYIYLHMNI